MAKAKAPKSDNLRYYMRNAYEEFSELLKKEILRTRPKDIKTIHMIDDAMKEVFIREFGKDPGGMMEPE